MNNRKVTPDKEGVAMLHSPAHLDIEPAVANLIENLSALPTNAHEPIVSSDFVQPLLKALGFDSSEWFPEFSTGNGAQTVDYAARKNILGLAKFKKNPQNPYLLIEVKGRQTAAGVVINLAEGTPQYQKTKAQITRYLLSPKCQTAQWGLITNGNHIQLFRKHGKVVFPATANYLIKESNIDKIIYQIKELIDNPTRALSICVYNDKGGVGKTTTVVNLAAVLRVLKKKVLVVDFDPQQGDLTAALGKTEGAIKLSDCLVDKHINIVDTIQTFEPYFKNPKKELKIDFDLIPSDSGLETYMNFDKQAQVQGSFERLKRLIEPLSNNYDYIIFDCPTNWTFFSKSCVYASDVILIPTQHDNFASLKNAKKVIKEYLPEIQKKRKDGKPIALPVFFNNHRQTDASIQRTHNEIQSLLKTGNNGHLDPDLTPYFYPKSTLASNNKDIFTLPQFAIIASAGFARRPAALIHKNACEYYVKLAKEYFL